jgi:bifunctional non-homologous end joining protein LigD
MRVGHQTSRRTHRDIDHPALAELTTALKHATMPEHPELMQCTLVAEPFDDPDWIFEPKLDGLRVLSRFDGHRLRLLSRQHKAQNTQFPDLIAALGPCLPYRVILDGEVVCLDAQGRSSFRLLQQRLHLQDPTAIKERMRQYPAYLYLFDLLYLDHYDVTGLPLEQRKGLLRESVRWTDRIRWTDYTPEAGTQLFQDICHQGGEGIIGKHRRSLYVPARSRNWVKIKCLGRQEFVIGGFTDPKGSRVGLGALLVGYYSDDGRSLVYAGKVGTGFTRAILRDLRQRLDALLQERSPFDQGDPPRGADVHWVTPALVAEIAFSEWTQHGKLRQPRFVGLRFDKHPQEVRRERSEPSPTGEAGDTRQHASPRQPDRRGRTDSKDHAQALEAYVHTRHFGHTPDPRPLTRSPATSPSAMPLRRHAVVFTHTDKVMFPEAGITKGEVLRFYERISERLLPHLRDRPVTLERLPEGVTGTAAPHFWQKHTPSYYPAWIPRVELPSERGGPVSYVLVNDQDTLLYLVNQGALTLHVWLSRIRNLDRPDFVLFDLDPGEAAFTDVMVVAKQLHERLQAEAIASFVKTSGKTGLHVLVPWGYKGGYGEARDWARQLAQAVVAELPEVATLATRKADRRGRVYVDVLQNVRGHHAVPPYVLRAVPQACVSTPLAWDELTPHLHPQAFTLRTIFDRLASQPMDPIAPLIEYYR